MQLPKVRLIAFSPVPVFGPSCSSSTCFSSSLTLRQTSYATLLDLVHFWHRAQLEHIGSRFGRLPPSPAIAMSTTLICDCGLHMVLGCSMHCGDDVSCYFPMNVWVPRSTQRHEQLAHACGIVFLHNFTMCLLTFSICKQNSQINLYRSSWSPFALGRLSG